MKNKISIFLMACTLLFATHIESIAAEQIKIGVAASVQDTVQSIREKRIRLKSGMDIYLNDRIVTGKTGSLQIMLLDETIFTLGPNSDMVLDEFVYDPSNDKGKVSAKVAKGVFRFITGKIARHDPSNMNVKIQAGNIGIRGTIVAGRTGPEGSTVILAGPGVKNNAGERPGAIIVSGDQKSWFSKNSTSASQQYINTPGEGTTVSPEGYVSKPRMMQKELAELNGLLGYKPKTVGKNNKGIKAETKAELEEDGEELNDKSGQNDADKKEEAADKENKQNITDSANSDIMQGSQEKAISDTTENSKKALLYAELPYLGISRASYQTRSEISGTKNDGSTIKRGLLFGTVVNFIDQYFQNTYLKITSAENNDTKYAAYPDGDTGSSYYAMEPDGDKASFSWGGTLSSYKGGNTSYYEDPDPDVTYGDVNVNMQLFNTAANPMPSLTADIKVYNDDNELLLAGIYDMNGSLYTGKFTNGEMLKYAAEKSAEAVFKSKGTLNPTEEEASESIGISKINLEMLSKVNFYSRTLSDIVFYFTPVTTDGTLEETTAFHSKQNSVYNFTPAETTANYSETSATTVSFDSDNFGRTPSTSNTDVGYPSSYYNQFYVSLMNYSSPVLNITGLSATISDINYITDNTTTIQAALASDYSDPLTIYELGKLGSSIAYAKYQSSEKINLFNTYTNQNNYGISAKNFSASVDFINNTIANTSFELSAQNDTTNGIEHSFTVTQNELANIEPYVKVAKENTPSLTDNNQNENITAMARIDYDDSDKTGDIYFDNTSADIYFGYEDSISFPVMKLNLATTYNVNGSTNINHVTMEPVNIYGSQQAPLNFSNVFAPYSPTALAGSVLPDPMQMTAAYTANGKWQGTDGAEYDTEFTGKFNFINGTYADARATINNNTVIYSRDDGFISSLASGSNPGSVILPLAAVDGMGFPVQHINAEVSFYEREFDVPSIAVVLTAAADTDNVFSGNSTLTTTSAEVVSAYNTNYMSNENITYWLAENSGKTAAVWQQAYNVSSDAESQTGATMKAANYVEVTSPLTINFAATSSNIAATYSITGIENTVTAAVSADIPNANPTSSIPATLTVNGNLLSGTANSANFNFINSNIYDNTIQVPDVLVNILLAEDTVNENISASIYHTGYTVK